MRLGLFLEALAKVCATDLVVIPVAGPDLPAPDLLQRLGISANVLAVEGRRDTPFELLMRLKAPAARLAAFQKYGRSSLAAGVSIPVRDALREHLGASRYDLCHIGRAYLAEALSVVPRHRVATMDLDEDESRSQFEIAAGLRQNRRAFDADWALAEAEAQRRLIGLSARRFDRLFISSAADAASIRATHPSLDAEVVENAVAIPANPRRHDDGATLLFVGSFGYSPNAEAMTWFIRDIWPGVRATVTDARLLIVGRDADPALAAFNSRDGIEVRGSVVDISEAYAEATIAIAPLRSGAGTRIKVLEAAAHGVAMIATTLGVRGLSLSAPDMLWLADDATGFATAIVEALGDPAERGARAARAFEFVSRRHDRGWIVDELAGRFDLMLSYPPGRTA